MAGFIARRFLWMCATVVGVTVVTFAFIYVIPADPVRALAGPHASAATVQSIRHQLGLDRPIYVQYVNFAWRAAHGDLGYSYQTHTPVTQAVLGRLPATAALALLGIICELAIGLPIGMVAALRRGGWFDRVSTLTLTVGVALPPFWIGLILLYVFAYRIPIFPLSGAGPSAIILPAITLGIGGAAYYARLFRDSVSQEIHKDYVRTAYGKGLGTGKVLYRHVVRNAILAVVTVLGMDLGYFLGGVVLVEAVFGWPGIGLQAYQAISYLDIPMITGTVLVAAIAVIVANFLVDVSYRLINPQIETS